MNIVCLDLEGVLVPEIWIAFAKETGINHGRGGSMHVNDLECRNMGFNGIQGSTMVTCLGTAFASVYNGTDDVTAVFLGDGTLGRGEPAIEHEYGGPPGKASHYLLSGK